MAYHFEDDFFIPPGFPAFPNYPYYSDNEDLIISKLSEQQFSPIELDVIKMSIEVKGKLN